MQINEEEHEKTLLQKSQGDLKCQIDQHLQPKIDQQKSIQENKIIYHDRYGLIEDEDGELISRCMVGSKDLIEDAIHSQEMKEQEQEKRLAEELRKYEERIDGASGFDNGKASPSSLPKTVMLKTNVAVEKKQQFFTSQNLKNKDVKLEK